MNKGLFITFEGGDACGKSTQVKLFKEYANLHPLKDKFVFIREPGGTVLGEEIRKLVLNYTLDAPVPKAELMLFLASRAQICEKVIIPALKEGKIVIADRFYDSTIAYQGMARGIMSPEEILYLNRSILGNITPDLTFYLKLSPEDARARKLKMAGQELDRMEMEEMDFHQKVCDGYDYIANLESERFHIIDARKSIEEIQQEIKQTFEEKLIEK
jgi:dTMP kinase